VIIGLPRRGWFEQGALGLRFVHLGRENRRDRACNFVLTETVNPVRNLRDVCANFVRAIDATALDYEATGDADLFDRAAALLRIHEIEKERPELAIVPTEELSERVRLIRQIEKIGIGMSVKDMRARIRLCKILSGAESEYANASQETLEAVAYKVIGKIENEQTLYPLGRRADSILSERKREAKRQERLERQTAVATTSRRSGPKSSKMKTSRKRLTPNSRGHSFPRVRRPCLALGNLLTAAAT
jgi:hypothetical protein